MNTSDVVNYMVQALYLILILSMPTILVASIVGVLFSLFQALTQIQEQTLSFAVKLVAVGLTLFLTAGWTGGELMNYSIAIFDNLHKISR